MRRISSKILLHLHKPLHKPPIPQFSREFAAAVDQSSIPRSKSPLKPCSKTQCLHFSSQGLKTPIVDPTASRIPSRQWKIKERSDLEDAFESADSIDEMLDAFKEMEASFDEKDMILGMACLKIGLKLDREGEDPEKALYYAQRALSIMDDDNDLNNTASNSRSSLPIAMTLQLLGSSCFKLKRFNDSLGYLNRANRLLNKLDGDDSFHALPILNAILCELFNVKTAMGRREEALVHLRKAMEIKEKTLDEDSKELGKANRDLAEAYVAVLDFKEALNFCLKALKIHKTHLGHNSVEVAFDRRVLGVIYTGLGEHEKALEENRLSQRVLKNWGRSSDLLRAEIDAANMEIALGRYDEAINTLKSVVPQTEQDSEDRALVFTSMAKALCNRDKFAEAKRCLEVACGIFEKKERSSPVVVAEAYMEISMQYEAMNEFETAILLLKRALEMLEKLPQEQHSVGSVSARVGWLLLLTGKVEQAIPYLEDATERLKESFGSKHYGVGYVYNNLGAAYMELNRPQSAAQVFAYAKEIMDVSLGPHHVDSIEACQNLSKAYAAMGSDLLAINFQEKVVESWEGHGPSGHDELKEAVKVLEQLKEKASSAVAETLIDAISFPKDNETFPSTISATKR